MSLPPAVLKTDLSSARHLGTGKVRDLYELGGDLLLVATDRLSAFDVVLPNGIPGRGRILCNLSAFWFRMTRDLCDNHMISTEVDEWEELSPKEREQLRGRTMRCKKADPLPVEWVVRGYLTGSGWKDYQANGSVSGVQLPKGLQHAQALPEPILTASTKAAEGHDEPISFDQVRSLVGDELADKGRKLALAIYKRGQDYAKEKGFILADTKFELGLLDERIILIDECLTPDSSRYWPKDQVAPGAFPESYDKQIIRNYLETLDWDKTAPGPALPQEIQEKALDRYLEIHEALTGQRLF